MCRLPTQKPSKSGTGCANAPGAWAKLLAEYDLDEAKWARVSAGWNQRMAGQGQSDPMATTALRNEYYKLVGGRTS